MNDEFIAPRHVGRMAKRIILTLENEAAKLRKDPEYDPSFHFVFMEGFYRALGIVRRFEGTEEE